MSVPYHLDADTLEEPPGREAEAGTGFNEATEAPDVTGDGAPGAAGGPPRPRTPPRAAAKAAWTSPPKATMRASATPESLARSASTATTAASAGG